jgi:hypothetical protein
MPGKAQDDRTHRITVKVILCHPMDHKILIQEEGAFSLKKQKQQMYKSPVKFFRKFSTKYANMLKLYIDGIEIQTSFADPDRSKAQIINLCSLILIVT